MNQAALNYAAPRPQQPIYPPPDYPPSSQARDYEIARGVRGGARTPSPTPSEQQALSPNKKSRFEGMFEPGRIKYTIAIGVVALLFILFLIFHDKIIHAIEPTADKLKTIKFGWAIPLGILIVLSFPPLFGHELVAPLCGLVFGLGEGFAIVAAGTLLGEIANFFLFKLACTARSKKLESSKITYACLARVIREGGFKIVLLTRYSAVPPHLLTALYSTCGVNFLHFLAAAVLGLPKQFALVFAGYVLKQSEAGTESKSTKLITIAIAGVTIVVTLYSMRTLNAKIDAVKPQVVYARRKARQMKFDSFHRQHDSADSLDGSRTGLLPSGQYSQV